MPTAEAAIAARLKEAFSQGRSQEAFDALADELIGEQNYPGLFELRLLGKRLELGLPAVMSGRPEGSPETIRAYEKAQIAAAREVGERFLADGEIHRAWPYFRAIGEPKPVIDAIERFEAPEGDERVDGLVEISYHEQAAPRRGFELILEHYGVCRAITNFGHYPGEEGREESAKLLVDRLTADLGENLKRAIEREEGRAPETGSIADLIRGRDWLFEGASYYLDSSHVMSVCQLSVDWTTPETLRLVVELTEYGRRLNEMFQFKGEPPFENVYEDVGVYLKALLGEDVDAAVEHFRAKLGEGPDPYGDIPAQRLVQLLARTGRYGEAIDVVEERLADLPPSRLMSPGAMELCQQAGDFDRMAALAYAKGDWIHYAAALASGGKPVAG